VKITKRQLKRMIKEEMNLLETKRVYPDFDDPDYGLDAEVRHQAINSADQFIARFPKFKSVSGVIKVLFRMGFTIVPPHAAYVQRDASDRATRDAANQELTS